MRFISSLAARIRRRGQSGVTTIEYAIMLVLVSMSIAFFGLGVSGSVTSVFSRMMVSLGQSDADTGKHNK